MRVACAAAAVAASAWLVSAQTIPAPPALPSTIDAVVDAAGRREPLKASEFIVTDGTRTVPVMNVRLVAPTGGAPLAPIVGEADELLRAAEADRIVGIYLDEYHLAPGRAFEQARGRLAAFVRAGLGSRDLVVIAQPLDGLGRLRLTTDRDAAAATIEQTRGRADDYAPASDFERQFIAGAPARIRDTRRQLTWSGLDALVSHLGRMPASRKTLLVLSDGMSQDRAAFRREGAMIGSEQLVRAANRSHVAVYALRPSPSPPGLTGDDGAQVRDESMEALARQTTGATFDGIGGIEAGLTRVLTESGKYYVLTFGPELELPPDGQMRTLVVSSSIRGVQVRARSGVARAYERPPDAFAPSPVAAALAIPRRASPLVQVWVGQTPSREGRTRIDIVWEPALRVPGTGSGGAVPARVVLSASRLGGDEVFAGALGATGAARLVAAPGATQASFDAPPGALLVRMDILDGAGRVLDRDVRDVAVAGMPQGVGVNTPAVFRAHSLPELRAIHGDESGTTLTPVAGRRFPRTDHLVIRFAPLSPDSLTPDVLVRLTRFGAIVRELPLTAISAPTHRWQTDLPLASLAAGRYALEFEARTSTRSSIERIEFDVVP